MRRVLFALPVLATALLVATTAFAQEDTPPPLPPPLPPPATTPTLDDVHLRNGGLVRGQVLEIRPGDHVTLRVEGGATKTIPWAEVDRVIVSSAAAPPTPPAAAPAPATPPPMVGPRARVHITSPSNVILYRRPAGSTSWVPACTSPCNEELPIGDLYRVTGNAVPASKEFSLEVGPGGTVDIAVDPASTGGMIGAGFLAGTGATAAYVGLLMTIFGQAIISGDCNERRAGTSSCASKSDGESLRTAGLVTFGIGAAATVGGILLFLNSAKTDIVQSSTGKGEAPRTLDAFVRQPTWRTASGAERAPAAPSFPIVFQHAF